MIDSGLAKIYQSHLEIGKRLAKAEGFEMETTLLPGKPFEKILQYVRKKNTWLLICGRIGIHSKPDMDIGSNSENLLRMVPCHVLLASGQFVPPIDLKAEESIDWTEEALSRMDRVPDFVRGVARSAVLRWALERGHSVITSNVIDEAMGDVLPPGAAAAMGLAAKVAKQQSAEHSVYICTDCGYTARNQLPVKCVICGASGKEFTKIDKAAMESNDGKESNVTEETTFDGVRLFWTSEAKDTLHAVPSGYPRRRAKASIEKIAKRRKLSKITQLLVQEVVNEETRKTVEVEPKLQPDDKPMHDEFLWTEAATQRLHCVPEGFMRNTARDYIENFARQQNADKITLKLAEQGITNSRKMMADTIVQFGGDKKSKGKRRST